MYSGTGEEEKVHSQGKLSTEKQSPPPLVNLEEIKKRFSQSKTREESYQLFSALGLDYGPDFQGIDTVYYTDDEALSKISLARDQRYVLQPGILDSAVQSTMALAFSNGNMGLALPFSVKAVNIYGEIPGQVWAHVKKSSGGKHNGKISSADIDLLDNSGQVLLSFKDFCCPAYPATAGGR